MFQWERRGLEEEEEEEAYEHTNTHNIVAHLCYVAGSGGRGKAKSFFPLNVRFW
jgi:hypothetical protein